MTTQSTTTTTTPGSTGGALADARAGETSYEPNVDGAERVGLRDECGRFVPGNRAARGRRTPRDPHKAALAAACTADDLRAIVRRLVDQALGGDVQAATAVLDRVLGRPRSAPRRAHGVDLGPLDSASAIADGAAELAHAASRGDLEVDVAADLGKLLELARAAREHAELEARIAELEERLGEATTQTEYEV